MVIDIITGILIAALAIVTLVALLIGLLAAGDFIRLQRCPRCGHWIVQASAQGSAACPYCRHEHLSHPITTLRHPYRELLRH